MNIPSNYPSPDQENVYYSVASVQKKLQTYFNIDVVKNIITSLGEYNLPVYVLDDSNTPSSYTITIFSKDKTPCTKLINSVGSIVSSLDTKKIKPAKIETKLIDGGSSITLDKSYQSTKG